MVDTHPRANHVHTIRENNVYVIPEAKPTQPSSTCFQTSAHQNAMASYLTVAYKNVSSLPNLYVLTEMRWRCTEIILAHQDAMAIYQE